MPTPPPVPAFGPDIWASLADAAALRQAGVFVAEGRLVVARLMEAAATPTFDLLRVLATPAAVRALDLERLPPALVDVRTPAEMAEVTGFNFHRGVLALVRRPSLAPLHKLLDRLPPTAPLVVAEHLVDVDNVGSLFRNARALGAAAVVLDDTSADPLYRKAVRTSMGAVLDVPWTVAPGGEVWATLRGRGYHAVALTPVPAARPLREVLADAAGRPLALVVGNEGEGLSQAALEACDAWARIPMADGADSLNVATALAVALYEASGR